jgi:hypothetical protein
MECHVRFLFLNPIEYCLLGLAQNISQTNASILF